MRPGVAAFVAAFGVGALLGLRDRLGGEDAIAERKAALDRHIHERAGGLASDDLEMKGFATDNAAQRDRSVISAACCYRRVESDRHAGGNLQGAGYTHEVVGRARRLKRAGRARKQVGADRVVIARLDDQEAAGIKARQRCGGAARLGHRRDLLGSFRDGASP